MNTPFKMRGFSGFGNSPLRQDKKNKSKKSKPKYSTDQDGGILERDPKQEGTPHEWFPTGFNTATDSIYTSPDGPQEIKPKKK